MEESTTETWRSIAGFDGDYEVSDHGRVRSVDRVVNGPKGQMRIKGKVLRPSLSCRYGRVGLQKNALRKQFFVHRLVAAAFIGPLPNEKQVNHIDGKKLNNLSSNLEYVTHLENMQHASRTGLLKAICGANHCRAKLTDKDVLEIRATYADGGVTQRKLADKYGVDKANIFRIIHRQKWAHLPPA